MVRRDPLKLPKAIDILGYKWKVKIRKRLKSDGEPVLGLCDPDKREILILKGPAKEMLETFFHECGHALIYELGLKTTAFSLLEDVEEILVEGFSKWLAKSFHFTSKAS